MGERLDWADEEVDGLPARQISTSADGVKTIIEYKFDDAGRKVKVTRRIRTTLVKERVNRAVAERKKWAKFGDERGNKSGPDLKTTQVCENIVLKLGRQQRAKAAAAAAGGDGGGSEDAAAAAVKAALKGTVVKCRICKGEHYTAKCPYKDAGLVPIEELSGQGMGLDGERSAAESPGAGGGGGGGGDGGGGGGGRYIAPHLRAGADRSRSGMSLGRDRDDSATLRVTNVSEDATDDDLRGLFARFGPLARIYLAKDRDTGKAKGYAFVSYHERSDAEAALAKMDKYGFDNLILHCEWAANRPQ